MKRPPFLSTATPMGPVGLVSVIGPPAGWNLHQVAGGVIRYTRTPVLSTATLLGKVEPHCQYFNRGDIGPAELQVANDSGRAFAYAT
jgi:hypothetical protein